MPKASRVAESSTSTSSAVLVLSGALSGRRTVASKHTVGETGIELVSEDAAGNWLEGVYTYTSANPTTMTRTVILSSSNNDADVTFPAGTKTVSETASAAYLNASSALATTSTPGRVKIGTGLSVTADGTVSYSGGSSSYSLPPATANTLGGIKVGANLTVGTDGTLNASAGGGAAGSVRVVYTSSTCTSDADVSLGSTNFGTDQRANLQAILDLALNGPLRVIWDGQYGCAQHPTITDVSLLIRDNTEIYFLPGCGAIFKGSAASASLLSNANRNDGRSGNSANSTGNKAIKLFGGILNGANVTASILQMFGIDGFYAKGTKLLNSSSFHAHFGNWKNVVLEDVFADKGPGASVYNDGIHFCGPGQYLHAKNTTVFNCGDDNFTLSADDTWVGNTKPFQPRGPITDVIVDGLNMKSIIYGFRILSGGSRVDNVSISRVRGSTSSYWLVIDNFIDPSQTLAAGPGNVGKVTIDDVDVECIAGAGINAGAVIDCKVEQLSMTNIKRSTFLSTAFPSIQFGSKADITQLIIDRYQAYPINNGISVTDQIKFLSGSKVARARISGGMFDSPSVVSGYPINVASGATIGQLVLQGNQGTNFTDFLTNGGTITYLHAPNTLNFMDTTGASSTWVLQTNGRYVEDTTNPGKLTYTGPTPSTVSSAKKTTVDAFGGNVKISTTINITGTASPALVGAIFGRAANSVPLSGITAGSVLGLNMLSKAVRLNDINGADASVSCPGLALGTDYVLTLTLKTVSGTTTESGSVMRVSDGFYVQTDGSFAATAVNCISRTLTQAAAAGEYGVYSYAESSAVVAFNNFTAVAAP